MTDAYYLPVGDDRFVATGHTVGPWADGVQHMGPPSALLARAMLRCSPREDTALAKLTVDILGPVPRAEVRVTATVLRPGRTIELIGAELSAGSIVAARATGWRLIRTDTGELAGGTPEPLPPPEAGGPRPLPASWMVGGYLSSIDWRWLHGSWDEPGAGAAWARPRFELVAGEPTDGLCRLLTVADSASGMSARLDPARWLFPNTDLTVHLHRMPRGDWVGVEANTVIGPTGAAVATATLHDRDGAVGSSAQILTVRAR
ncbi:MAG TPA: thioesterase family protein [Pseudonocardiaceae bacterium]|jgi:acyl-coenzyme A thioesterase PaaI-like protein